MINPYEKIIKTMRSEGARNNPRTLQLGEMTSDTSVLVGELEFEGEEVLFSEHLLYDSVTKVEEVHADSLDEQEQPIKINVSESISKLASGDIVICFIVDDDTCVVIDKVVSA